MMKFCDALDTWYMYWYVRSVERGLYGRPRGLGCGDLFCLADPRTVVLYYRTKTERTTMRWGNGTPSTTSVCTSIRGASSSIFYLSVCGDTRVCGVVREV